MSTHIDSDDTDLIDAVSDELACDPYLYGVCSTHDYGRIVGGVIALIRIAGFDIVPKHDEAK